MSIYCERKFAQHCEQTSIFSGEVELDESYFGGQKKGDERGRGVSNRVPVFGILKRDGKVYTQVIRNASKSEIHPIIRHLVGNESTIYTDKWRAYDGLLVLNGYKHYRSIIQRRWAVVLDTSMVLKTFGGGQKGG